jgi:ArsR family transcriptional regulator
MRRNSSKGKARIHKAVVRNEDECCVIDGKLNIPASILKQLDKAGGLKCIIDKIPSVNGLRAISSAHQALADPVRIRILHSLAQCDLCPCLLKTITGLPDSKLSYHLNVLEEAWLISSYPQKKWRIYGLTKKGKTWIGKQLP